MCDGDNNHTSVCFLQVLFLCKRLSDKTHDSERSERLEKEMMQEAWILHPR